MYKDFVVIKKDAMGDGNRGIQIPLQIPVKTTKDGSHSYS